MVDPRRVGVVYDVEPDIAPEVAARLVAACAEHVGSQQHQVERVGWLSTVDADHWSLGCIVIAGPLVVVAVERCDAGVITPIEVEAFRAADVRVVRCGAATECVLAAADPKVSVRIPAGTKAAEILLAR